MIKLILRLYSLNFLKALKLSFYLYRKVLFYKVYKRYDSLYQWAKYKGRRQVRSHIKMLRKAKLTPFLSESIFIEYDVNNSMNAITSLKILNTELPLDEKIFFEVYEDFELTMSVHRFVWTYDVLLDHNSYQSLEGVKKLMFDWIKNYDRINTKVRQEPYSIGERISSWLFFYTFTHKYLTYTESEKRILSSSIELQLKVLTENLEYQGEFTNNHILNNAKAFYIAGGFLDVKEWQDFGLYILKSEMNNFFENGFFLENSSHYQMIYSKNFLEMILVSEFGKNDEVKAWLKEVTSKIMIHSNHLQSNLNRSSDAPLFGDISPDIRPDWLIGYPFVNTSKKSKWYNLFRYNLGREFEKIEPQKIVGTKYYTKITHLDFEVWVWTKPFGLGAHGHEDNGNCVIFYKGKPILIDAGRFKYTQDDISNEQISGDVHFIPSIKGESWDFSRESPLGNNPYWTSKVAFKENNKNSISYQLESWDGHTCLERTIFLKSDGLLILDAVQNENQCTTSMILPFKKEFLSLKLNTFVLPFEDLELGLSSEAKVSKREIQCSNAYGTVREGSCISINFYNKIEYVFRKTV